MIVDRMYTAKRHKDFVMLPPEVQAIWNISKESLEQAIGQGIANVEPLSGGGNNRVYKLHLTDSSARVLKLYFHHASDTRNRLKAEYDALSFLWKQGVRAIPEPQIVDWDHHFAVYAYVEGIPKPATPRLSDLDQVFSFARVLKTISTLPEADTLPPASEARFSIRALWEVVESRARVLSQARENPLQDELGGFLSEELEPYIGQVKTYSRGQKFQSVPYDAEITRDQRTLSPSDFGFHNAILTAQEAWVFQDFEYFGWDDPSKLVADFILHPAMQLGIEQRSYVVQKGFECFGSDKEFARRLELVYPIYGIKWCLIILNEFVPEFRARRILSGALSQEQLREKQAVQLKKARQLLERIRKDPDLL